MRNLREESMAIARAFAGPVVDFRMKLVEDGGGQGAIPAWKVMVKVGNAKRGKHVATIISLDPADRFS